MNRLQGKVALITGGGSGIGQATCERFAEEGAAIALADIDAKGGKETEEMVRRKGGKALFIQADVSDEKAIQDLVAQAVARFGTIDILVNNAAAFVLRGIDATVEEWQKILAVNVMALGLMAKHVVPHMRKAGGGAIVNLGSMSGFIAQPNFVTYNATKGAVSSMTRCMALDLAPDNIRVNAVCPGTVWTPIVQRLTRELGLDRKAADAHPDWGASHMIKRLAEPREIANAILFLASDEASFITASNMMVDGGYTAK